MTALMLNQSAFASFEATDSSIGNAVDLPDHGEISAGLAIGITSDTEENDLERGLMPGKEKSSKEDEKSQKDSKQNKKGKKQKKNKNKSCETFEKLEADNMMQCTSPCSDDYLTCENGVDVVKPMPGGFRCYENKGVLTSEGHCVLRDAPPMVLTFDLMDACTNYPELEYCANDVESEAPYNGQFYFNDSLDMNGTWFWKDSVIVSFGLDSDDDTGEQGWNIAYRFRFGHDIESNRTRTYTAKTDYGTTRVKNWKQVENVDGVEGDYNCKHDVTPDPITLFVEKVLVDNPALFVIVDGKHQLQSIERSEYTTEMTVKAQELGEEYMRVKGKAADEDIRILGSSRELDIDEDGNEISANRPGLVYHNFFMFNQSDCLEAGFDFSGNGFDEALIPDIQTLLQQQLEESRTCDEIFGQDWTSSIEYSYAENGTATDYVMTTDRDDNDLTDLSVPIKSRSSLMKFDDEPNLVNEDIIKSIDGTLGLVELCSLSTLGLPFCENVLHSNQGSNLIRKNRRKLEHSMTKRRLELSGDTWVKKDYESFLPQSAEGGDVNDCTDKPNTFKFTLKKGRSTKYSCGDIAKQSPRVRIDHCDKKVIEGGKLVGFHCPMTCNTCNLTEPSNQTTLFDAFSKDLDPATKKELLDKFLGTDPGRPEAKQLLETFQNIDKLLRTIYGFGDDVEDGIIVVYDLLQSLEEIRPLVEEAKSTVSGLVVGAKLVSIITQIKPFLRPVIKGMEQVSKTLDRTITKIRNVEKKNIKPNKPKVQKALKAVEEVKGAIVKTAYVNNQLFVIPIHTTRNCESVDAMAELVNDATQDATTKIFDVADDIEDFFDQVAEIRNAIQQPMKAITDIIQGIKTVVGSLDFLGPVVKPFNDLLDVTIGDTFWGPFCTQKVRVSLPVPCGAIMCCSGGWWNICLPCGVKMCWKDFGHITIPKFCHKEFKYSLREIIDGIQGFLNILMAPLNLLADLAIKAVILLIKETTGYDLGNLQIPGLTDINFPELGELLPNGNFDDLLALPAPFDKFANSEFIDNVLGAELNAAFVIETLNEFDMFDDFNPICE